MNDGFHQTRERAFFCALCLAVSPKLKSTFNLLVLKLVFYTACNLEKPENLSNADTLYFRRFFVGVF